MLPWDLALGNQEAVLEQGKLGRSGCELPKSCDGEAGQVLTPLCGASPAAGSQRGAGKLLGLGSSGAFASPMRLRAQPWDAGLAYPWGKSPSWSFRSFQQLC